MATAFPDWLAMCFYYTALLYIPASITEMLRSGIVIFVALFSVMFLKKRFDRSEAIGIIVLFLGMLAVGWAGLDDFSDDGKDTRQIWLGVFFLTLSMIFDGFFFVIVEKFYNVYHIGSMAMVS
jgi:drug/metabolite transporter (DMT)-like permease